MEGFTERQTLEGDWVGATLDSWHGNWLMALCRPEEIGTRLMMSFVEYLSINIQFTGSILLMVPHRGIWGTEPTHIN